MTFFSRPDLSNLQFKQLNDSILTLSGQTQIATTSGLTLIGSTGGTPQYIPIVATGATNDFVLTYDGGENVIKLKQSTASGGTGTYPYPESATTTVGGLPTGQDLYNEQVVDILHDILVPTLDPTLTNPSLSSFIINPTTSLYEMGTIITVTGTTGFNAGCIDPQYTALSDCRSNGVSGYTYGDFGVTTYESSPTYTFGPNTINSPSNIISSTIHYSGGTQPKNSSGANYDSPLLAGCTSPATKTISGIYPYYWGTLTCAAAGGVGRPTACCIKDGITDGTLANGTCNKVVSCSTNTISVTFGSTASDYLWFATPVASTTKTCWYVDALNNNLIGGVVDPGGNLFPVPDTVTGVNSFESCWSGESYKIYVSNYQSTAASSMQLKNS